MRNLLLFASGLTALVSCLSLLRANAELHQLRAYKDCIARSETGASLHLRRLSCDFSSGLSR